MTAKTKIIVIGAGWSGLVAAKTYLQTIPLTRAESGLYPGLIANSPTGLYEYSHMTMVSEKQPWFQLIPGTGVQTYLEAYARKFDIYSKIRFCARVTKARRRGVGANSGWLIETNNGEILDCDKLVVACGLYNRPHIPFISSSTYTGVSIHNRDLGRRNAELQADPSIKNIIVVGGCKSAVEACNVFLPGLNPNKRHRVSWVIRPSGTGAPLIVQDVDKSGNIIALNQTRVFAAISPSIYEITGAGYRFFHPGTYLLGTWIISLVWRLSSWALTRDAKYDSSVNGRNIKPQGNSMFYDVNSLSLIPPTSPVLEYLHKDDDEIFKVHRAAPIKLQDKEMVLMSPDGSTSNVPCDAVIWCTGWLPSIDFFSPEETKNLGLPVLLHQDPPIPSTKSPTTAPDIANPKPAQTYTSPLTPAAQAAEAQVLSLFPSLRVPARSAYPPPFTPYRLYRQCLPLPSIPSPSSPRVFDRSLAFSGLISNGQTAICSELTAIYTIAFLENLLPTTLPSSPHCITREIAERDVELALAFQRRRYGARGARDPEIVLEVQSFLDRLCKDLGVRGDRKMMGVEKEKERAQGRGRGIGWVAWMRGVWRERFEAYFARDYEGVVGELLAGRVEMKGKVEI